jgi:transcriptional regulator with XRE-family HTH domain
MAEQRGLTKHGRAMRRLLAEQQRSGLTLAEFARRRGLRAGTLSWWRHHLRAEEPWGKSRRKSSSQAGRFLEVTPTVVIGTEARNAGWFEIVLDDGTVVRVPARFAEEELRRLLAVLRC